MRRRTKTIFITPVKSLGDLPKQASAVSACGSACGDSAEHADLKFYEVCVNSFCLAINSTA